MIILAYFGGLRHTELMDLELEKIVQKEGGILITHSRAKQRSDKLETRFLVPRSGDFDYAAVVEKYLLPIIEQLGHFTGRVFYKGTSTSYMNQSVGKNTISKIPFEMSSFLGMDI